MKERRYFKVRRGDLIRLRWMPEEVFTVTSVTPNGQDLWLKSLDTKQRFCIHTDADIMELASFPRFSRLWWKYNIRKFFTRGWGVSRMFGTEDYWRMFSYKSLREEVKMQDLSPEMTEFLLKRIRDQYSDIHSQGL